MDLIKDILKHLRIALFMKHPCEKCIVRPICKSKCDNLKDYNGVFGYTESSRRFTRIVSWD
jgi:radical SAM protein with 4Fe4S-binding SPASM domain